MIKEIKDETKHNNDIMDYAILALFLCVILIFLLIVLAVNIYEPKEKPKLKEMNETKLGSCEIWEVCDYKQSLTCATTHCQRVYKCNVERRNCTFKGKSIWDYWIPIR